MTELPASFVSIDDEAIAFIQKKGKAPGIVWLGGYRSDMRGTKAEALHNWAGETDQACLRHDYSGHGESGGQFRDGTISRWLKQSLAVFRQLTDGPQILVGSSMGAWIALRMIEELHKAGEGHRAGALLLLAPAPDFTIELMEPKLSETQRADLAAKGYFEEFSEYGPEPNMYTRALFEDGWANQVLKGIIETHCPVHILQGMADPDVPYEHALKLVEHLPADDVTISLIRDGDHRLSRPQDIAMIVKALEGLTERIAV